MRRLLAEASGTDLIAEGNSLSLTVTARLTRPVSRCGLSWAERRRLQIVQARGWWKELRGGVLNVSELAAREKLAPSYLTRVLRLAFLSPQVTDAVLAGKLKEGASVTKLLAADAIDPLWARQAEQVVVA